MQNLVRSCFLGCGILVLLVFQPLLFSSPLPTSPLSLINNHQYQYQYHHLLLLLLLLLLHRDMGMAAQTQFHVLAVDDSMIDRKLIERLFKISSYHVTTVDSGSKALEFLGLMEHDHQINTKSVQEMEVNLVITDYCMPGMTGYDLLKKIKESSSLKDIPVVIMSSENVPSRISRCLEEGAEEFLLKPVRLADVNRLRPHLLRGKSREQNEEKEVPQVQVEAREEKKEKEEEKEEVVVLEDEETREQMSIKRKTMEEISPERTRTRYSELEKDLIRII